LRVNQSERVMRSCAGASRKRPRLAAFACNQVPICCVVCASSEASVPKWRPSPSMMLRQELAGNRPAG